VRYLVLVLLPMFLRRNFKQDRRRRKRQLLNTSVRVFTKSGCIEALGVNISDVGMCLFTMANLPLGSQIQVEFLPPRCTGLMSRFRTSALPPGAARSKSVHRSGMLRARDELVLPGGDSAADLVSATCSSSSTLSTHP
jgi:hypothetical protein